MSKKETLRRYVLFLSALVIGALGVTLTARAAIGINSLACFSYVTALYWPVTMGTVTMAFNITMLLSQFLLLPKDRIGKEFWNIMMQIPALLVFGVFVDAFMFLTRDFHPETLEMGYLWCVASFVAGSVLIAVNVSLQAVADVAKLSCDAFVIALAERLKRRLGTLKLWFDLIMVAAAAVMSLLSSGFTEIQGIREGTILGAFIVGPCVQIFYTRLLFLRELCADRDAKPARGYDKSE